MRAMIDSFARFDGLSSVFLNRPKLMEEALGSQTNAKIYSFTLHEVFYEDGLFKQTRSSPNWQGDIATMATCKHQMRTWSTAKEWIGKWNAMFCPKHCANNALFFVGQVSQVFLSNYNYGMWMGEYRRRAHDSKSADHDPRGDIYTPKRSLVGEERYEVSNFRKPPDHTRSVEYYKDGTPKWWKDIRYLQNKHRPAVFLYSPAFLFSRPYRWTGMVLGRYILKNTVDEFLSHLSRIDNKKAST